MTKSRALSGLFLFAAALAFAGSAEADGYQHFTLSEADAAAVNATLLPEYFPNHVAAGSVYALDASHDLIVIPVTAPLHDYGNGGKLVGYTGMEILVLRPR